MAAEVCAENQCKTPLTDGGEVKVTVTGTRSTHHVTPSGLVDVPFDYRKEALVVLSLHGSTFTPSLVTSDLDGGFRFTASSSPYYVNQNGSYVVSSAAALDLGLSAQGRPDVIPRAGNGLAKLRVNATGLLPFEEFDALQLASESVLELGYTSTSTPISLGSTSLSNVIFDYFSIAGMATLEAAKGDTAVVSQLRSEGFFSWLASSGRTGPIDLSSGKSAVLNVALTPLSPSPIALTWRGSKWAEMAPLVHPKAKYTEGAAEIVAVAGGTLDRGWVGHLSTLFYAILFDKPDGTYVLKYANPSSSWAELGAVNAFYEVPIRLPDAHEGQHRLAAHSLDTPAKLFSEPLMPAMKPPALLRLDDRDAQGDTIVVESTTPLVSWSATFDRPSHFQVSLFELFVDDTNTTSSRVIGRIVVDSALGNEVRVPPYILHSRKTYIITVIQFDVKGGLFAAQQAPFYDWSSGRFAGASTTQFSVR